MGLTNNTIIDTKLVEIDLMANDKFESIRKLGGMLFNESMVNSAFIEAIIHRESVFPTGLQLKSFGVAIPHTESEYVNHQSICIGILKKPVEFIQMGTTDTTVPVKLIIMLAIKNPNEQVEFLQALIEFFQNEEELMKIVQSSDKSEVVDILKKCLERKG